jgi:hypothetical protein
MRMVLALSIRSIHVTLVISGMMHRVWMSLGCKRRYWRIVAMVLGICMSWRRHSHQWWRMHSRSVNVSGRRSIESLLRVFFRCYCARRIDR